MNYRGYLKTAEWKQFRSHILAERPCCEYCGSKIDLQVHHISYDRLGNESEDDVIVLCREHHSEMHGFPVEEMEVPDELMYS